MRHDLTPDRFLSLWTAAGGDEFPFPLRYRSSAMWEDEHAADLRAADEWRRSNHDPALERAVHTLLTADLAIEVYGRGSNDNAGVFARAAVSNDRAVLAQQTSKSADIRLATTMPAAVARMVVDAIPLVPAGREAERSAATREVVEPSDTAVVRRTIDGTDARALRRLLQRERTGAGSIRVLTRASVGYTSVADIGWFDVVDDGRYLLLHGDHMRVRPGTPDVVHKELAAQVGRASRLLSPRKPEGILRPS